MTKTIISAIALLVSGLLLTGCASIVRGGKQQIHINAYDAESNDIVAANCTVSNDDGTFRTRSNRSVVVERDKDFLRIDCATEDFHGSTVIDGEINVGFVLVNILIDLCIVSCWVDGLSGSWAEYPTMIDVPMDKKTAHPKNTPLEQESGIN